MTASAVRLSTVALAELLGTGRFDLTREANTQAEIELFLAERLPQGCRVEREVRLSHADRIDFIVGEDVGIEVKLGNARPGDVLRQLERYAAHPRLEALILLTNRALALPAVIGGKPVFNVSLGRAWL